MGQSKRRAQRATWELWELTNKKGAAKSGEVKRNKS